ncbi:MAG TPA: class I SAM-dependent methyltransferase [Ktedonobacter sp.]|jgi:ubiquinone/menaquinone biosynthesis C-methylase UbiE|nr:class I SAM-dependent methyltransferase [Ktedonobacter sp.]HCF86125.1 class I SAM-dependent methyltransferase [Ktedonobacter sp.]
MAIIPDPIEPGQRESRYFVQDSGVELARLVEQEQAFTRALGGLIPEQLDQDAFLAPFRRVLDVACGSGGWVLSLAQAYPHLEVMGFDIDERMIIYATTQAGVGGLDNASFRVMDLNQPLDYPDNYFDLVSARFMTVIPTEVWPSAERELVRITRPGGIIRHTEAEHYSVTNSPAFETLSGMWLRAFKRSGCTFSPDGRNTGNTPVLRRMLREAGCQNIQIRPWVIDWSAGTPDHEAFFDDLTTLMKLVQPFLIAMGETTQEEADRLYHQAELEMISEDFCALWYLLTVWGEKP